MRKRQSKTVLQNLETAVFACDEDDYAAFRRGDGSDEADAPAPRGSNSRLAQITELTGISITSKA